ncbi:MAG: aminoglycoside phosphotransferase family protein [Chloroflexota bacterium]|nr:aminoglycoside phosphotransferase family protein [Chloroflexota bacterium]
MKDADAFFAQLTPKIQADLPGWYGSGAKLVGEPTFQPRDWSYFFRYVVQVSELESRAILVKVRHTERMKLSRAIVSGKMGQEARQEYETLKRLQYVFNEEENSSLFLAIRPLALYEELNAVVMEQADLRTLRSFFRSPKMLMEGQARRAFEGYLELAGRWLRIFHDVNGSAGDGLLFDAAPYENACANLDKLKPNLSQKDQFLLGDLLDKLYKMYSDKVLPYCILHDDFNSANIFVTRDGRICSFDPHNRPGPLYIDLAKIITDVETYRAQLITNGLWVPHPRLQTFHASLLRGYFGSEAVDQSSLSLFRLLSLLEKWKEAEIKFESSSGKRKLVYSLAMPQMRKYFLHLIHKLISEKFQFDDTSVVE